MNRLTGEGLFRPITKLELPTCEHCVVGKTTRKPFGKAIKDEIPLQLTHSNIYGPMSVKASHGAHISLLLYMTILNSVMSI